MSGFIDKIRFCVLPLIHQNSHTNRPNNMTTSAAPFVHLNQVFVSGKYIGSIHMQSAGNWVAFKDGKSFAIGARQATISFLLA